MEIRDINNPFDRYCAFLVERDTIYKKKTAGEPWPWTKDEILKTYRFCDIYRERDRTSLHYQRTVRDHYKEESLVLPATVLYRWFNRISTCDALFNQLDVEHNHSVFERYIYSDDDYKFNILADCIHELPTPHVTGAFLITSAQGYEKGIGVAVYFHDWCLKNWRGHWTAWRQYPPRLQEMYEWLKEDALGLGSFMTAQLIADLKYVPFMKDVPDWWTWAAPGPGSMRGLNAVLGRPMDTRWNEKEWLTCIQELREAENKELVPLGLGPFHAQDTQNHCCEFSKYTKTMLGTGRPRQVYHVS